MLIHLAMQDDELSLGEKGVYAMCYYMHMHNQMINCSELAKQTLSTKKTINNYLFHLVEKEYLVKTGRNDKNEILYGLNLKKEWSVDKLWV